MVEQGPSNGILFLEQHLTFQENGKKALLFKPQPYSPETIYSKFQKRK